MSSFSQFFGSLFPQRQAESDPTIADIAAGNDDFDILVKALAAADLVDAVSDRDADLTVFAPTDAAFTELASTLSVTGSLPKWLERQGGRLRTPWQSGGTAFRPKREGNRFVRLPALTEVDRASLKRFTDAASRPSALSRVEDRDGRIRGR